MSWISTVTRSPRDSLRRSERSPVSFRSAATRCSVSASCLGGHGGGRLGAILDGRERFGATRSRQDGLDAANEPRLPAHLPDDLPAALPRRSYRLEVGHECLGAGPSARRVGDAGAAAPGGGVAHTARTRTIRPGARSRDRVRARLVAGGTPGRGTGSRSSLPSENATARSTLGCCRSGATSRAGSCNTCT